MKRHDPDMNPGGVELQGLRVKGQHGEKAGNVLLGKSLPSPKPVRDVRGMKPANASPIEDRAVGQIDQYSCES